MRRFVRLEIKVAAGASKNAIQGWMGPVLKLSVREAPEKGRANRAVCALLADALALPPKSVSVEHGATASRKRIRVADIDEATLHARLSATLS